MRFFLAGTLGVTISATSLFAQSPQASWPQPGYVANPITGNASATLGRPVPAASLGRPRPMAPIGQSGDQPLQPAAFRADQPIPSQQRPNEIAPLLAPIATMQDSAPMPKAPDGANSALAPVPSSSTPSFGPVPATPAPGCASCVQGGPPIAPMTGGYGAPFMGAPMVGMMADPGFGGYPSRFYTSADFLLWWVPTIKTPLPISLASTQPFTGGALPPSQVAIGNTDLIGTTRVGGRFGFGMWLDPCHKNGIDLNYMFLGPATRDFFAATSAALPTLLRPYVVINDPVAGGVATPPGRPNFADIVAQNGDAGNVAVHTYSFLTGADANYRRNIIGNCNSTFDMLFGFRYMNLTETLSITENGSQTTAGAGTTTGSLNDSFRTTNNFFGYQLGFIVQKQWGPWSADFLTKVGAGDNYSVVTISGAASFNNPTAAFGQGLFAQPSNIGAWNSHHFSILTETGLNIGYNLTPRLKVQLGYSVLYWSNVLRPGDQIDPIIDETLVPKPPGTPAAFLPLHPSDPHPVVPFKRSDFFGHGLNIGLTYRW
jgi:hypothetical protein